MSQKKRNKDKAKKEGKVTRRHATASPHKMTDAQIEQAIEMRINGADIKTVAGCFGVCTNTISNYLKRYREKLDDGKEEENK